MYATLKGKVTDAPHRRRQHHPRQSGGMAERLWPDGRNAVRHIPVPHLSRNFQHALCLGHMPVGYASLIGHFHGAERLVGYAEI